MLKQLKQAVQDAVAPDPLSEYKLSDTTRHVGFQRLLRAVDATERSTSSPVTVFVWSNQHALERCGGNHDVYRFALLKVKEGVQALTRVRHPNVLRVMLPWTEDKSRHRCVFVTERVDRWIGNTDDTHKPHAVSSSSTQMQQQLDAVSRRVENAYGMLQIGRVLEFLHSRVSMSLLQLSPASIVVTPSGDWKLADMTHCVTFSSATADGLGLLTALPASSGSLFMSTAAPLLDYTAPEVVAGFEALATAQQTAVAASKSTMPDLFDFSSTSSSGPKVGPVFADSDVYSFILTTAAVVEGTRVMNSGGELAVYHRQVNAEASNIVRRLFPQWLPAGSLVSIPRVTLSQILQTECFASREVRLLSELPQLLSMEPKAKLTLLKGFHDEIARGAFASSLLQTWIIPPLLQQTSDERMIKFVVPILLEAAFTLSRSAFDQSLRPFLSTMISRAIATRDASAGPTAITVLAQLIDKFPRFWEQFSSPKDVQGLLGPLLCSGLLSAHIAHDAKEAVRQSLKGMELLLTKVERAFPNADHVAGDILSGLISAPEEAPRGLRCLEKLLPCTTREGRERELEPKLVAGLQEMCKTTAVSPHDVEQLLKVLMSIVGESSVDHVATVTLPLLCPLLIIRHVTVRQHISKYVNELVQLVIRKRSHEEQEEERQKQHASAAFVSAPSAAERNQVLMSASDSDATSFFTTTAGHPSATSRPPPPIHREDPNSLFGDMKSALPVASPKHPGYDDVFGF
jgi:hypothetical protein